MISIDAVWDIECAEWDQFLCGALWTAKHGVRVFRHPAALADAIMDLPNGSQCWAHAGGRYDVLWLLDHLNRQSIKPEAQVYLSGSSATSVRFKDGPWLRDSARLMPMPLKTIAGMIHRAKGEPDIPCSCGKKCGGYCSLSLKMPRAWWKRVIDYLILDVEILRDVLLWLVQYAAERDIELRGTVGGSAWATAAKWCDLDVAKWDPDIYEACAWGYMGGNVQVGRTRAKTIYRYDRRSAYPAAIMESLPIGEPTQRNAKEARRAFGDLPGIYQATLDVPESISPVLPIRTKNRLCYPWGKVTGAWPWIEIDRALETGAKIDAIHGAITWDGEAPTLRYYAKKIFWHRDRAETKALDVWLKFLANSLTGKLGQSPDWRVIALGDMSDREDYEPVGRSPWVWSKEVWRIPDCAYVHWSATLTARARVELHRQIEHAGDAWVYSDTDSCFATKKLTRRIGRELGEWDYEGKGTDWIAEAPKVYAYRDTEKGWKARAKGVPDGESIEVWRQYADGERVSGDRGVESLLRATKGDRLFQRRTLTRRLHKNAEWCGGRLRDGEKTRAPHVGDLYRLP